MKIFRGTQDYDLGDSVVALGTFDGVHAGHRALIRRAIGIARAEGWACAVCTFDRHPLEVLCPERVPRQLMTLDEKLRTFEALGADAAVVQPFTKDAAQTDAETYLRQLSQALQVKCVVAGFNYTFGAGGRGDADMIRREAPLLGFRAEIVEAVRDGNDVVSSTLIRSLIESGDAARVERLSHDMR